MQQLEFIKTVRALALTKSAGGAESQVAERNRGADGSIH
jgi:hypothetical protein